jgi:hypothetical protein
VESPWDSKKRPDPQEAQQRQTWQSPLSEGIAESCIPANTILGNDNSINEKPGNNKHSKNNMYPWSFGTINIRTGNEYDEGYKLYSITKEVEKAKLQFCCL